MSPASSGAGTATRVAVPDLVVAAMVVALGLFAIVDARRIDVPLSSNVVGPRVFPYAVGTVLVLAGATVLVGALRGRRADPEAGEDVDTRAPTDWVTLGKIVAGFALHVLVVDTVGWALAGAFLFAVVAWALGAHPVKATVAGLAVGFVVQVVFVAGLGVSLPAGPFEGVRILGG